ncbi:aromatic di-alanine and TPR containing protein [Ceratobasidium sp. AG-Ba]|nr:aromatic di-alanine and TPR containing protein [Ceratobasidium sp. AG-Ba]
MCIDSVAPLSICFYDLGTSYQRRFERLGESRDLDCALEYLKRASELIPDSHPNRPSYLSGLGVSWYYRFKYVGEPQELSRAIEYQTRAVDLTPKGHPNSSKRLSRLGRSLQTRFECLGELTDLDRAIDCGSRAVDFTPNSYLDKPIYLTHLAVSRRARFERLGDLIDLNHAIDSISQAVDLTPDGHPDKLARLSSLGVSRWARFERLGELGDLDHAMGCISQAVDLTPDGHPDKPGHLSSLGVSWRLRFERLGELADLDHAIGCISRAMELTPAGHPDKPGRLSSLGVSWRARFERLGELVDLDCAIECHTQAIDLTPDGHPSRPGLLSNLGELCQARFELLGQLVDLAKARAAFRAGALSSVLMPDIQMRCARSWAKVSELLNISPLEAYKAVFYLLPRLVWIGQTAQHRSAVISGLVSDLVAQAATWAISVQSYDLAIEWLEQGRSILWSEVLQFRQPLDKLAIADSELAQQLKYIASELEVAGRDLTSHSSTYLMLEADRRNKLAIRWDKLLSEARSLPGFHEFMLPPKAKQLKKAASDGPVVIIHTYKARCDALVIVPQREEITHVPLTRFSQETFEQFDAERRIRGPKNHRVGRGIIRLGPPYQFRTLERLWSDVVEPILSVMEYKACTCTGLLRVTY